MFSWKSAALVAALVGAAGAGAAVVPVAHGQAAVRVAPRVLDVFSGRGSQIGVSIRDVDPTDAKGAQAGVLVEEVSEDSPAAKAGLKKGDVVVEFDGERVRSARQFTRLVQETVSGRKVAVSVLRDGQRSSVTVEPREGGAYRFSWEGDARLLEDLGRSFRVTPPPVPSRPAQPAPPAPVLPDIEPFVWRSGSALGITVGDLSDQLAEYFGTKEGVLVTSVYEDSAAARAGVKAGDVVTSLNGTAVTSPSELRRRIQRLTAGEEFTLGIVRDKKAMTLKGKVEEPRERRRTFRSIV